MKPEKLFYSMGEVAEMFDVNPSLLRFWESEFDVIRPKRNKKGNRLFTPSDIENLKLIYHLVKERGMTLDGAKKALKGKRDKVSRQAELLERLQKLRAELAEVRDGLRGEAPVAAPAAPADDDRSAAEQAPQPAAEPAVKVVEEHRRGRRKRQDDESKDKELFAFYEQSLF